MEKIKDMKNDPKIFMYELRKRKKDFMFWFLATLIVLTIFIFLCAKEVSALQTLSSIVKTFSFLVILVKVVNYQSCSGISKNSLICFFIALLCRIFVFTFFPIRLRDYSVSELNSIFDKIAEYITFFIISFLLYAIHFKYQETSDINSDNKMPFYYLCIPAFIVAIPFKPWVFRNWFIDLIWIYSIFLESVSIYPQITLFSAKKWHIEKFTSHFLILQGISSIFGLFYWIKSYFLFNDRISLLLGEYSGYLITIAEIVKLIIVANYLYLYLKSLFNTKNHKKYDI